MAVGPEDLDEMDAADRANGIAHGGEPYATYKARGRQPATIDPAAPLAKLEHLRKVAVLGRAAISALADRPIVWIWDYVATAGLIVLLAAGPGSGKTTLLFLLLAARANCGRPVAVLGRTIAPAPAGKYLVIVENEHSDESAARILRKSLRLLGVGEEALDRVVLVARGNVRIGSPEWGDIEQLIASGLVSDVALDTLARCAPSDANDEREQVEVFARIAGAIERAPTAATRPTCWTAAHTRKCDGMPTLGDVGGSTQRAGQADVVLLMGAERVGDKLASVKVSFGKVREKDAEDWPEPVEYTVGKAAITLLGAGHAEAPLEERVLAMLAIGAQTKTSLSNALHKNKDDIDVALTALFAARRIRTTVKVVRGRDCKAFELAEGPPQAGPVQTSYGAVRNTVRDTVQPTLGIPRELTPDERRTLFVEDS